MGRLSNSWSLFKQSLEVLKKDKELVVLPVLSGITSLIIMLSFFYPAYTTGLIQRFQDQTDPNAQNIMYGLMFVLYLILFFVGLFFQSALIYGANQRLGGGDPTLGSALAGAVRRIGKIFLWSMFAATVSLLIQLLEAALRRGGSRLAASIIGGLLGTAWTLLVYFAVPVLLFEEHGVFGSLKRSGQLFKQRWGESLVGEWGIGFIVGLLSMLGFMVGIVGGFYLIGSGLLYPGVALAALGVLWVLFFALISPALAGIYKTALYRYAKDGEVVPYFTPAAIQGAYHPRAQH